MGIFNDIGKRIGAIVRGRDPEKSNVVTVPGANLPQQSPEAAEKTKRLLRTLAAYEGRLSPSAGPFSDRIRLYTERDLTPEKIIEAQQVALTSGAPYRWMDLIQGIYLRDGHYASCTDQRVTDVVKGSWRLTPHSITDAGIAAANFCDHAYRRTSRLTDGLEWLLKSNLYGFAGVEIEWEEVSITFPGPKNERIGPVTVAVPRRFHNVAPKHFRFDMATDDPLFWIVDGYQPLPYGKFVFMEGCGSDPIKVLHGHAWQCVWYSMFRSIGWAGWATFVERFGMPIPYIGYNGDLAQFDEYKTAMEEIMAALGTGNGFRYPKDNFTLDIKDPPRGGTASDPHSALSDACDAGQSIRVLGGQLNNKIGNVGSFAASSNHLDVKYGIEELDGIKLWERLDEQASAPMLRFNAEPIAQALNAAGYNVTPDDIIGAIPKGKHHIPGKTDPLVEMQIAAQAVSIGMPISMRGMFERMDLERARDDADRIPGVAQSVGKGAVLLTDKDVGDVNEDVAALEKNDIDEKAANKPPAPVVAPQLNGKAKNPPPESET